MYYQLEKIAAINNEHHAELLHEANIQRLLRKPSLGSKKVSQFSQFITRFGFKFYAFRHSTN